MNHPFWGTPIFGNTYIFSVQLIFFFWGGPEEYKIHQKIHDEDDDDEMAAAFLALTHLLMYDSSCE